MAQEITRVFVGGEFMSRLNVALRAVEAAEKAGDSESTAALAVEYDALKAEAEEAAAAESRVVRLRSLSRREWKALQAAHPPRQGEDYAPLQIAADRALGVNAETAEDDLVYAALVRPEFTSRAAFDEWANDVLTNAEWAQLVADAHELATEAYFDPKSLPSSVTRSSGEK